MQGNSFVHRDPGQLSDRIRPSLRFCYNLFSMAFGLGLSPRKREPRSPNSRRSWIQVGMGNWKKVEICTLRAPASCRLGVLFFKITTTMTHYFHGWCILITNACLFCLCITLNCILDGVISFYSPKKEKKSIRLPHI